MSAACAPAPTASPSSTATVVSVPTAAPTSVATAMPAPTASPISTAKVVTAPTAASTSVATAMPAPSLVPPTSTTASFSGVSARLNEPFTLQLSQWANLSDANNTRIFFTNVREDTRCPVNVNCYQPGRARVLVTMETGSPIRAALFDLSNMPADMRIVSSFGGYLVRLIGLEPAHTINPPIPPGDYRVTLLVTTGSLSVTQARFNVPFTLKLGQSVGFDGSTMRLTFESVKLDSRCPTHVLCATSGTATLVVLATHDSATDRYSVDVRGNAVMTSFPAVRTVSVTINALALTPYPQSEFASKEIASDEYEATLLVINPAVPFPSPTPR